MLFTSLHWKCTNEKFSIVGALPSLLLDLCCMQEFFSSIQQQIGTRLNSSSNAMVYAPIYIFNCYHIMANLDASSNDTILVINRGLTVSEYKHGNLGIIGSGDSSILGSVYSKQLVKNIDASQKYISCYYFKNLYSKSNQTFRNKSYLIMIKKSLEGYLSRI